MAKLSAAQKKIIADAKKKTGKTKSVSSKGAKKKTVPKDGKKEKPKIYNKPKRDKVIEKVSQDIKSGKRPNIKKTAIEEGYSENYAKTNLSSNKTFVDLLKEKMGEEYAAEKLTEVSASKKTYREYVGVEVSNADIESWIKGMGGTMHKIIEGKKQKEVLFYIPDHYASIKALDTYFKITGAYAPKKIDDVSNPLRKLTNKELDDEIERMKSELINE